MEAPEQGQGQGQEQERGSEQQTAESAGEVDLDKVRELVLLAYPDVVPEMVGGTTLETLLASVQPAKAAYERIVAAVGPQRAPVGAAAPLVPAGQPARQPVINMEELSPHAKIVEGLRRRDG